MKTIFLYFPNEQGGRGVYPVPQVLCFKKNSLKNRHPCDYGIN